jgi:hypothetical protein
MDLEMWAATLVDKARNRKIMDGEIGFVSVSDGVNVLEKVEFASRTEGDVHLMGNPHINTGPVNWRVIARNITIGLVKNDPANSAYYQKNRDAFIDKVDRALFGDKLVEMFGGETLVKLLENKTLFTFSRSRMKVENSSISSEAGLRKPCLSEENELLLTIKTGRISPIPLAWKYWDTSNLNRAFPRRQNMYRS